MWVVGCGLDDHRCLSNLSCQSCTITLPAMAEHNGIPKLSKFILCIGSRSSFIGQKLSPIGVPTA